MLLHASTPSPVIATAVRRGNAAIVTARAASAASVNGRMPRSNKTITAARALL
jgi:hypothetical protein